jgi:ribosome-binding protein aMBF1 (putative translation factor)
MAEPKIYDWSVTIGSACNKQLRTFADLAEKLTMDVIDLMRQCNRKAAPSKALVKGLARELDISESYLDKLAEEVRKDLGPKQKSPPGLLPATLA